jgi:hypothetical protein
MRIRLGFMEVPPECRPEHHCDLAGGRSDWLELAGGWIDNIRDVDTISIQSGGCKSDGLVVVIVIILAIGGMSILCSF